MNNAELKALSLSVSNEARALYLLYLRPNAQADGQSDVLQYKKIKSLLNGKKEVITLGRQINALIKELAEIGLISFYETDDADHSLNGKRILLTMLATEQQPYISLHMTWQKMRNDWEPDQQLFTELCELIGLIDMHYSDHDKGEFIAYWLTRPNSQFTLFQWTQKFVQHLKQKRLTKSGPSSAVGHQKVNHGPGLKIDDNAKKLVEKYRAKSE